MTDPTRQQLRQVLLEIAAREEPVLLPIEDHIDAIQDRMTDAECREFRRLVGEIVDQID